MNRGRVLGVLLLHSLLAVDLGNRLNSDLGSKLLVAPWVPLDRPAKLVLGRPLGIIIVAWGELHPVEGLRTAVQAVDLQTL